MSNECLLVIVATPAVEETLVDWLLSREDLSGFSSMRIDGHGSRPSALSLAEQVTGRQRKVMFHVHTNCTRVSELIEELKTDMAGSALHYWAMPLITAGQVV